MSMHDGPFLYTPAVNVNFICGLSIISRDIIRWGRSLNWKKGEDESLLDTNSNSKKIRTDYFNGILLAFKKEAKNAK